jgi:hypothetical protein
MWVGSKSSQQTSLILSVVLLDPGPQSLVDLVLPIMEHGECIAPFDTVTEKWHLALLPL